MAGWRRIFGGGRTRPGAQWRRSRVVGALLVACVGTAGCYPLVPNPAWQQSAGTVRDVGTRAPRVLIFGDSIGDQHGSHAAVALREAGIDVTVNAWWGWGLFTRDQYDMGATNPNPPAGSMMEAASSSVAGSDPDVVVVYSNHNYWPPYPRDAAGREITYGSAQFTQMVQAQLTELIRRLTVSGAQVYLVKPLPETAGQTAATNAIWTAYLGARERLGFGVINAGDVVATKDGQRVEDLYDCAAHSTRVRPESDIHLTYYGAGLMGTITARSVGEIVGWPLRGGSAPADLPAAMVPYGSGYRLVTCDGGTFRGQQDGASLGGTALGAGRPNGDPVVDATNVPGGTGAWAVTAAGKVLAYGGAPAYGNLPALPEGEKAVGILGTASGLGYWVVTNRGAVHRFGDAAARGDLAGTGAEVIDLAGPPDRGGYWLLTAAGRVAAFGSAGSYGDLQAALPPDSLVELAAHPQGTGYWVLDAAGNVHGFGAAQELGSAANQNLLKIVRWAYPEVDYDVVPASEVPTSAVSMLPTSSGNGYWVWLANGAVCHFGDAGIHGGVHRGQLDFAMVLLGLPFYGAGDCAQTPDAPSARSTSADPLETMAEEGESALVETVEEPENLDELPEPPPGYEDEALEPENDLGGSVGDGGLGGDQAAIPPGSGPASPGARPGARRRPSRGGGGSPASGPAQRRPTPAR